MITQQLRDLIARYNVFFLDQFGTLHDGTRPYPGAIDCLRAIKAAQKAAVILSNSGKSGTDNAERFIRLGFPADSFAQFVTSGDVAVDALASGMLGISVSPETRCYTISSGSDNNLAVRLGLRVADRSSDADLLVISGSEADRIGLDAYEPILRTASEASVPAICTNPDIRMVTPTGLAPAAGSIARLYESMGGSVHWIGKPHASIYAYAHRLCGHPPKERIVGIGDSLDHDIAGAAGFGIDGVLVRKGVSGEARRETLHAEAAAAGLKIAAIIDALA